VSAHISSLTPSSRMYSVTKARRDVSAEAPARGVWLRRHLSVR
jgi:hypothetical protein